MLDGDLYAPIARYYALEQGEQNEDLPFFRELAQRTGGPVLDLGAGAGRVAADLAAAGLAVTALEASPVMLALAGEQLPKHLADRVTLVGGDMLNFRLAERFPLAVCAAGTFAHITDEADQLRALRTIKRHLTPGGVLAVVLQNPYQLVVDPPSGEVVLQWRGADPATGAAVAKYVTNEADLAPQLLEVGVAYDVLAADGQLRRYSTEFTLRWTYQRELELLLLRAGFEAAEWYGDYDRSAYASDSPLLIVLAQTS